MTCSKHNTYGAHVTQRGSIFTDQPRVSMHPATQKSEIRSFSIHFSDTGIADSTRIRTTCRPYRVELVTSAETLGTMLVGGTRSGRYRQWY